MTTLPEADNDVDNAGNGCERIIINRLRSHLQKYKKYFLIKKEDSASAETSIRG
ncbi:hypothetical protein HHK36_032015 [Tetracentron sinense]|uniref:Uncharacterized protein n=1 Tax=Tetracentron sinense TaxID=13715 RepID=A0A834Y807_TETSI|nr:hypothetical protein HHK36_032015 [Tetracentron sinense]